MSPSSPCFSLHTFRQLQHFSPIIPFPFFPYSSRRLHLISSLERRNGLALSLVKSVGNNASVFELDVGGVGIMLEGKGVLHPLLARDYILAWACNRATEINVTHSLRSG